MAKKPAGAKKSGGTARPLWAPWRISFITGPKQAGCFLCDKGNGGESSADGVNHVIARGGHAYVLMNAFPYNSGHLMVAPYRHVGDLTELDADELAEMAVLTVEAEKVLKAAVRPQGFNIGYNLGAAGGAGVPGHVHCHIVPRWVGDTNFMPVLGDVRVVPQALEETAALLRKTWAKLAKAGEVRSAAPRRAKAKR
jgi:ATP adenylyltransferase